MTQKIEIKKFVKRTAAAVAGLALLSAAGFYAFDWWTEGRFLESTNDSYVKANSSTIAPKVSGYISEVLVSDNQPVKPGQVLAKIDDRDFRTAQAQAQADVASAETAIKSLDAQISLQRSSIDQASADIGSAQAVLEFATQDNKRYQDLMKTGFGTVQRAEQASANVRESTAQLAHDHASLTAAKKQIEVLQSERAEAETKLESAKAAERQAELNLSYTTIASPIEGMVGARQLRVGQYVQAGTELMAVVPLQSVYVVANFKETQLTNVRGGEEATVAVDTFPGVALKGKVDSLAPASGLEFSLLPPDNATGNFTKIVQRIPVKIVLDPENPLTGLLRPGMSVESTIDTKDVALAEGPGNSRYAGAETPREVASK